MLAHAFTRRYSLLCALFFAVTATSCHKEILTTASETQTVTEKATTTTSVVNIADPLVVPPTVSIIDPTIIKQDNTFYLFGTGDGLVEWSSTDLVNWKLQKRVFASVPSWINKLLPGIGASIWAPDISYYNGQYYLYYCVSQFGTNNSAIGVATNKTLNPADANYQWIDHGMVIRSYDNVSYFNALDPNVATDDEGNAYLVFGSFWQGIKMAKLSADRLSVAGSPDNAPVIASRNSAFNMQVYQLGPANNAVEGGFVYKKNDYYYLFASFDYCCRGSNSNYKIVVGRSKTIDGSYVDAAGVPLANGGGTVFRTGDASFYAVGHNAVINVNGNDYLVYFGYDVNDNAKQKLRIEKLTWNNDFPAVVKN